MRLGPHRTDRYLSACLALLALLVGVTTGTAELRAPTDTRLPEAGHECTGTTYEHRVCKYYNLVLWNDTFYYPTTDEPTLKLGVPSVALSWVQLPYFQKFQLGANGSRPSLKVVRPSQLPFPWPAPEAVEVPAALLWMLTFQDNHGHLLGEHGPSMHALLCTHLGRCSCSEPDTNIHILLPHDQDSMLGETPAGSATMFKCFSKHPMRQTNDAELRNRPVLVRKMLAGVGPSCRAIPWCRPRFGRSSIAAPLVLSWRQRILDCVGLPAETIAPTQPVNVVLVKRPYQAGRGFLNAPDAVATMQEHFKEKASFVVREVEDPSLLQQATMYHNASIVIQMHGAALGNMIFLPRGACVIDIVPQNNLDKHGWAFFMAADFKPLGFNPIAVPPQKTVLMLHKVKQSPEWRYLSSYWRHKILQDGVCPENADVKYMFDAYMSCNFQWFLKSGNVILDPKEISGAISRAIEHLDVHAKQMLTPKLSARFSLV